MQRKLQGVDLWRTSFAVLKGGLIAAGQLLSEWSKEAHTLSSDWAVGLDAGRHLWEGPLFQDSHIIAFQERLERVSPFKGHCLSLSTPRHKASTACCSIYMAGYHIAVLYYAQSTLDKQT